MLLATLFSLDPSMSFWNTPSRGWGVLNDIFYIAFALLLFIAIKQKEWTLLWNALFTVGGIAALAAFFQYFELFPSLIPSDPGRPASTFGNTIFFAVFEATLIPLLVVSFFKARSVLFRVFYAGMLLLTSVGIFLSQTRGVFVALAFGAFFLFLLYPFSTRFHLKKILAVILTLGIMATIYIQLANPPSFLSHNSLALGLWNRLSVQRTIKEEPRFASWKFALQAFAERPILGYGPYNSSIAFDSQFDSSNPTFY